MREHVGTEVLVLVKLGVDISGVGCAELRAES